MKKFLLTSLLLGACTLAAAKLPPPSPEVKAKSDEAAAKTAWTGKADTYKLCQAQDRLAVSYYQSAQAAGKAAQPATVTPPCSDPGAFAYVPVQTPKPIEAAGAHSPADTAVAPPSSKVPDAVLNPNKKL